MQSSDRMNFLLSLSLSLYIYIYKLHRKIKTGVSFGMSISQSFSFAPKEKQHHKCTNEHGRFSSVWHWSMRQRFGVILHSIRVSNDHFLSENIQMQIIQTCRKIPFWCSNNLWCMVQWREMLSVFGLRRKFPAQKTFRRACSAALTLNVQRQKAGKFLCIKPARDCLIRRKMFI